MDRWMRIDRLAARQHGCVSRQQGLELGFSRRGLYHTVRRLHWRELQPGVWGLPGTPATFAQQLWAARLALSAVALVTGSSALHLLGIVPARPEEVTFLVPAAHHRSPPRNTRLIRAREFPGVASRQLSGLANVSADRALADHARLLTTVPLGRLMARGCGLRRCTLATLNHELSARSRWPGRAAFRQALSMLKGELTHSGAEREARRSLRATGIAVHPRPYPVLAGTRTIAELDVAVPSFQYGAEVDGPHHDLPEVAAADKQRDRRLRRMGWTIDRFPVELVLERPQQFVREFEAGLARCR